MSTHKSQMYYVFSLESGEIIKILQQDKRYWYLQHIMNKHGDNIADHLIATSGISNINYIS